MGGSTTPFRLDGKVAVVTGAARGKRVFGIFKRFPNEGGRSAHLSCRGAARLMAQSNTLLANPEVTPLGVKGLGEIGIVGTAGAVANAIFHATGKRVRSLPITIDKLLDAEA